MLGVWGSPPDIKSLPFLARKGARGMVEEVFISLLGLTLTAVGGTTMVFDLFEEATTRPRTTKDEKEIFYNKQRGKCMYCGTRLRKGDGHIDHKMPTSRDGANTPANKQLLCGPCNTRKGTQSDGEFRRRYKDLLLPARQSKGPPSKEIKLERFDQITKAAAAKRAKSRRGEDSDWFS